MKPTYIMRPMQAHDIPQVVAIDRLSFSTPWPARTYEYEINQRNTSHMVVIEAAPTPARLGRLRALIRRISNMASNVGNVAGYGGCWLIAGEAHISTIAVHPDYRGRSLGELLLCGMLSRAIKLEAEYSVLEVRASNMTAQALYRKYEYEVIGRRKGYYRDDGEDALLMEVRPLDDAYRQRFDQRVTALSQHVSYLDEFTNSQ